VEDDKAAGIRETLSLFVEGRNSKLMYLAITMVFVLPFSVLAQFGIYVKRNSIFKKYTFELFNKT